MATFLARAPGADLARAPGAEALIRALRPDNDPTDLAVAALVARWGSAEARDGTAARLAKTPLPRSPR